MEPIEITYRRMTKSEVDRMMRVRPPLDFNFRSQVPTAGEVENEVVADAPEMAVRVSHPQAFVEELFIAAWRPIPNPGGVPAPEETSPRDDELIQDLRRLADLPEEPPDGPTIGDYGSQIPGDCWGEEAIVTRPQITVGPHAVTKSVDVEREFFVGLLRERDLFLFARADRHGRVSLPLESAAGALTDAGIRKRTLYLMETAISACQTKIPGFSHGQFEFVPGVPERGFRPFVRSLATNRFGPKSERDHLETASLGGKALAEAASPPGLDVPR